MGLSRKVLGIVLKGTQMRTAKKIGVSIQAIVATVAVVSSFVITSPSNASTAAPALSTMDQTIVGSGSDTTYDLMMAIDKVYNAANGCAAIWLSGQPKDGSCDTADGASGNGTDKTQYPWVNDSHSVIKELYPVGSGNGAGELCNQGTGANATSVRKVDFARASSKRSSCTDLQNIAYAEDAVSWYHFTKDRTGADTPSSIIASLGTASLSKIFDGTYTKWSDLNNKSDVLDVNGAGVTTLSDAPIIVYVTQSGSGTFSFFGGKLTNATTKMTAQSTVAAPSASPSASPSYGYYTTNQENFPSAIYNDGNEANAIYFMSVGRYKQLANLAGSSDAEKNSYSSATAATNGLTGRSAVASLCANCQDALGQVGGIEPTFSNIQQTEVASPSGNFSFSRRVYNVLRYPSANTLKYLGYDSGWLCNITDDTKDRIKQVGYRTLINNAIISEGFVPLPKSTNFCRKESAAVSGGTDSVAPTITLATPSPSAAANGTVTINVSFSEATRGTDASKLTVTQSGNNSLSYTTTSTNSFGGSVTSFDANNTTDADPYAQKVMKNMTINVSGIAYDADATHPVVVSFAAGAVTDLAGNASASTSFNVASNTTAPDTIAPTVSGVSSVVTGKSVWSLTFSEPVRGITYSKFSFVKSVNATAPVAQTAPATTAYTCANTDGITVPCFWATNSNVNDPSGALAVKTMTINTGLSSANNGIVIASGAFADKAGNLSAATSVKDNLANVADTGSWSGSTATAVATRTFHVWGKDSTVVFATGANGGVATVMVDGTLYDSGETVSTVGALKGINLYTASNGTTSVTVPGTVTGWHTVKVAVVVAPSAANTTGLPSKRLSPTSPSAPYSATKKATFVSGTTVTINSVSAN